MISFQTSAKTTKKWLTSCPCFGKLRIEETHLHTSTLTPVKKNTQRSDHKQLIKKLIDFVHTNLTSWPWVWHVLGSDLIVIQAQSIPSSCWDTQGVTSWLQTSIRVWHVKDTSSGHDKGLPTSWLSKLLWTQSIRIHYQGVTGKCSSHENWLLQFHDHWLIISFYSKLVR